MDWLQGGTGRALLDLFGDQAFDIRLRDDCFVVYEAQCVVAKVEWRRGDGGATCRLSVHEAYLRAAGHPSSERAGGHERFSVTEAFIRDYAAWLPALRRAAVAWQGRDGLLAAQCMRDNQTGTPLLAFDRQIVLPGGGADRLDVLAVSADRSRPLLVAVELKRGVNSDIQEVARQTLRHVEMLDPDGTGVRRDIAEAYARVWSQMRALGRLAPDPALMSPGIPVVGLAAVAEQNAESQLLRRAQSDARTRPRPIGFCQLDLARLVLPDPAIWAPVARCR